MSVYTSVSREQLEHWLGRYEVGALLDLRGISAGIENTNYVVATSRGRYVLTLFEHLAADDLPYYLNLQAHLSGRGIPCPAPVADRMGGFVNGLNGKPASLLQFLDGESLTDPGPEHCAGMGTMLARMHLAGLDYPARMANPRGARWRQATAEAVLPLLEAGQQDLLREELQFLAELDAGDLPWGVIHADLFRDNVLFSDGRIGGVLDFYFACDDAWIYDLAVVANDWCVEADGGFDSLRLASLLRAYHAIRPLVAAEREAWPAMLRAAALRFWLSRLRDRYFPRPGEMTFAKDPAHFQRILEARVAGHDALYHAWV